jgi:DtxR family Mn-dependent transcriptional regulator
LETRAVQDYLKAMYELRDADGRVTTSSLAQRLGVAPASATVMIKRLAADGLATHAPYQGVALAPEGERIALEMIRHHRLVERFLADVLDVPWDEVHAEAERWEHVLSEELEDRIDRALDFPTTDPHGAPIPRRDGQMVRERTIPLSDLEPGGSGVVAEVSDEDAELLRYVAGLGLIPGARVRVIASEPFGGSITVRVGRNERVLGPAAAAQVRVTEGPHV